MQNNPLFLDTFDLRRERGNTKNQKVIFELPETITNDAEGVNVASQITMQLQLNSVSEGIYLRGELVANIWSICSVCDELTTNQAKLAVSGFYLYEDKVLNEDVDDLYDEYFLVEDRYIDLLQLTRDTLHDSFEFAPICSDECANKPRIVSTHNEDEIDSRLAILKDLL